MIEYNKNSIQGDKMSYILGLDIGIASVGWAILNVDKKCDPYQIRDLGVRIFDKAENPKDGAPLALPRREARGARRRNRRRRHRLERMKQLIVKEGMITKESLDLLYNGKTLSDIYEIRYRGLEEKLETDEWVRLLIHLAKRRGFRSNRKKVSQEDGKLLKAINENKRLLELKGYRTPGEMFYKDEAYSQHKRNTTDDYLCTLSREMLIDEVKLLFEIQNNLGNPYASESIQEKYLDIYTSQRSFDEGPGGHSPYQSPIEQMIGKCTLEDDEKRASKASYSFQYFVLLTNINNLSFKRSGQKSTVTPKERKDIIELAFNKEKVTYRDLRKLLNLQEGDSFKGIYPGKKDLREVESKTFFCKMEGYHTLRKALESIGKDYIKQLEPKMIDDLAYALTLYKTDDKISKYLSSKGVNEIIIRAVEGVSFSQYGHLSIKALNKIIPYLEEGMTYDKACEWCGYTFNQIKLPDTKKKFIDQITNPVVRRAVSQSLKVVEAIIRTYGAPAKIHIELARDMGRNFTERNKIEKIQQENRAENEKLKKEIESIYGIKVNGNMLVKYKLWKEQQGHCMYSNTYITPDRLLTDDNLTDIDHIIPYSKCFDDTYNNKVLVLASENRQKGNQTPYEYFGKDEERWPLYEEWVRLYARSENKRQRLLKKHIDKEDEEGFKERNLNDTRYITKMVSTYLKQKVVYDEQFDFKKRVIDVNGAVTAYCRKRWGLSKVREEGDLHHALDAVVIACITNGVIKRVTEYHQIREDERATNIPFPQPWNQFREEVVARLEPNPNIMLQNCCIPTYEGKEIAPVFVSRMPRRKNTGAAHKETLRGSKLKEEGYSINRVPITSLKLDKEGEIEGYYNKEANLEMYEAIKQRLVECDGDAARAFDKPFYRPQKSTKTPIQIKKVRIQKKTTLMVDVNGGKAVADNDSMVRVDIFNKDNKYYIVPIYMRDVVGKVLPNKAIVANKPYKEWIEMNEEYTFKFSIYPNDLVYFKHKKGISFKHKLDKKAAINTLKEGLVYYVSTDSSTGAISLITHDNKYLARGIGVKTLEKLEKYVVDELGNVARVNKETRLGY